MRRARFARRGPIALAPAAWGETYDAPAADAPPAAGGVGVISISGPLTNTDELFFDSYASIKARVGVALDRCSAVVLKIDSPGGDAVGSMEVARELRAMASAAGKRLVAFVEGTAASAAYAIASACSEIVTTPSAVIGSIGVIDALIDQTAADAAMGLKFAILTSGARKADGNPHAPIDDAAIGERQRHVDTLARLFFAHVAESRGMSAATIEGFEARCFIGADAVSAGLADAVGTLDTVISALARGASLTPEKDETTMATTYDEALAALKAVAEGDDDDAANAKKMLAALEDDDPEKKPEDEAKAEDDDPPPSDEDKKKKPDAKAKAQANVDAAGALDLAVRVRELEVKSDLDERTRLLATRPDLMKSPAMRAWLSDPKKSSIATVRNAVKAIENRPQGNPAAAAAAVTPAATRGDGAGAELTDREIQKCKARGIEPAKYAVNKAAMTGGR